MTEEERAEHGAKVRAGLERKRAAEAEAATAEDVIAGRVELPKPEIVAGNAVSDSFALFLTGLDAETRALLTETELRSIYETQLAKALEEKRALKRKGALEQAAHAARMATGLVSQSAREAMETLRRNNQIVPIKIELPPSGDQGEVPDIGLRIDNRIFLHGRSFQVTEAQAASMRETMYRVGEMELLFKGQNARQRRWLLGRAMGNPERNHINLNPDGSLA